MKLTINGVSIESYNLPLSMLLAAVNEKVISFEQVVEALKSIGTSCQDSEFFTTPEKAQDLWKDLGADIAKFAEQLEEKIKKAGY